MVLMLEVKWKRAWMRIAVASLLILAILMLLSFLGVIHSLVWWDKAYIFGTTLVVLALAEAIRRNLRKGAAQENAA